MQRVGRGVPASNAEAVLLHQWRSVLTTIPSFSTRLFVGMFVVAVSALAARSLPDGALAMASLVSLPVLATLVYITYEGFALQRRRHLVQRHRVEEMSHLHLETLERLASAIDAKDQLAPGHIRRVQRYATALATACEMSEADVRGVQTAALLHDIGKLAVPDHILSKPGPLSPAEFQKVRTHPQIGADIVASVPFPYPVVPLILSHHERWDGRGYPAGLKGEDIPLGARILAIVDFYDVILTERPYHRAATLSEALEQLRRQSGGAFDPALVDCFIEMLPRLRAERPADEPMALERPIVSFETESRPASKASPPSNRVFQDIALAHREIYALYEMAQAMGGSLGVSDTMTLIASKLENLVPYACCALFLHDPDTDTLGCSFATGTDSGLVRKVILHCGDGLTGRVARERRALLNGRPGADLEACGLSTATLRLRSAIVCPLVLDDELIGTLAVYHVQENYFSEDHRRLMERVSAQAAAVVRNSLRFERTQEDSLTDALTGLPNTRYLFMHLSQELARAQRQHHAVALMVIDLDEFKSINDTYGHHAGDRALRDVAAVLRRTVRPYDVCIRYAGDEFIVVLSNCGRQEAEIKAVEIQEAVDQMHFEARPGRRVHLLASIGLAVSPEDGEVYESLLVEADRRMYIDKAKRRARRHDEARSGAVEVA